MKLVHTRLVTDHVERWAVRCAALLEAPVTLNDYYVEVPAKPAGLAFSKSRFTEYERAARGPALAAPTAPVILDFEVKDADAEFPRIDALDFDWIMPPTTQPWGHRSMVFRGPSGVFINVFSRPSPPDDLELGQRR